MNNRTDSAGLAIPPWWLTREDAFGFLTQERSKRVADMITKDEFPFEVKQHNSSLYRISFSDKPPIWVTKEEYCLKALQYYCDRYCHVLHLRFRGDWKIIVEGQHGQLPVVARHENFEIALTNTLAQLDALWDRT